MGVAVMVAVPLVLFLLLRGTAAVGAWAYPFLNVLMGITTAVGLPVLLLLAHIRRTRAFAGGGILFPSYIYGATLWI